ncbi:MAG: CBS domain-containing protein [Candidatus Heimdallarchaeota archaeon]|nr:CBS domain-containing protein [Candidatus Heimdallarchaeota archaeon]MCK4954810.1 CBS domain-containing protein [Candidatus Heimdallarchaeota archaeon]
MYTQETWMVNKLKSIFDKQKFDMAVKEIMTKNVVTVKPEMSAEICAKLMIKNKIGSVVVVEKSGKSVGIITKENLIKHVIAENASAVNVYATDVMSKPLLTASPSLTIIQAMQTMFKEGIRHLVITGNEGKLLGICTDTDIFKVVPQLILLEQEYLRVMGEEQKQEELGDFAGYCDDCREYSDKLLFSQGLYKCPNCAPPEELIESNE